MGTTRTNSHAVDTMPLYVIEARKKTEDDAPWLPTNLSSRCVVTIRETLEKCGGDCIYRISVYQRAGILAANNEVIEEGEPPCQTC